MSLPERINVIRTVTYYVPDIVASLEDMGEEDLNIDRVLDYISDWVDEDMSAPPSRHDLVYQDENGEEL
mgnify:CR=1 FL=1|jgi:hypothetical protein